jgi:hypothetical protein
VVVVRLCPFPVFVIVTIAPEMAPPVESVIVPVKAPVPAVWADMNGGESSKARTPRTLHATIILIDHPVLGFWFYQFSLALGHSDFSTSFPVGLISDLFGQCQGPIILGTS